MSGNFHTTVFRQINENALHASAVTAAAQSFGWRMCANH